MAEKSEPKSGRPREAAKPDETLDQWQHLIQYLQFSPREFYARVEQALADRQVPKIELSRVDLKEGDAYSARREYLRVARERLVFDVCAAPFGSGFFVSWWFWERRKRLGWILALLAMVLLFLVLDWVFKFRNGLWRYSVRELDMSLHTATAMMIVVVLVVLLALYTVWQMRSPPDTFYRQDLMAMYRAAVHAAVTQVVDEITKAQGIQPMSDLERRPVFRELVGSGGGRRAGSNGRR